MIIIFFNKGPSYKKEVILPAGQFVGY